MFLRDLAEENRWLTRTVCQDFSGENEMSTITLSSILDDIQAAEQGLLDNGENLEDFSEWAGHYKLRQKRMAELEGVK